MTASFFTDKITRFGYEISMGLPRLKGSDRRPKGYIYESLLKLFLITYKISSPLRGTPLWQGESCISSYY